MSRLRITLIGAAICVTAAMITSASFPEPASACPIGQITNTSPPQVSGTAKVGGTLTTTNGTWTSCYADITGYTYQWFRNGGAIPGATGQSYGVTSGDGGQTLFAQVRAHNEYGASQPATSNSISIPVEPPPAQCADGRDNDGDGKVDYPADPGCTSSSDNDETDPAPPAPPPPPPAPPPPPPPPPSSGSGGDGRDTPGVVRNESGFWRWYLSNAFDATVAHAFTFAACCPTPVVGDWGGDGIDSPGVFSSGRWILGDGYDDIVDYDFFYGQSGDVPLVGDWNNDGLDTVAVRRGNCFYWKNALTAGSADRITCFGNSTDIAVVGDWDGNGTDTPGVVRNGVWWLSNGFDGSVWRSVGYGNPGDRPLVGDWNGDGVDTVGVQRGNWFYLSNDFTGATHHALAYGNPGDVGVVGDWNRYATDSFEDEAVTVEGGPRFLAANSIPERYAPLVYLHPDERYFPASARRDWLRYTQLWWSRGLLPDRRRDRGQVNAIQLGESLMNFDPYRYTSACTANQVPTEYFAYDFTRPRGTDATRKNGLCPVDGFYLDEPRNSGVIRAGVTPLTRVPVYYHFLSGRFVTYWFFYPYDDGAGNANFNHEGDWERIAIDLDSANNPVQVRLYRHSSNCSITVQWSQISKVLNTQHPKVFSARGTHGTYSTADSHPMNCEAFVIPADVTSAGGYEWQTWKFLADVQQQPWYGFGGAWGEVGCCSFTTGPLGPSKHKPPAPSGW